MSTLTLRVDGFSGTGLKREHQKVDDLPAIYRRKTNTTARPKVTLSDEANSSTDSDSGVTYLVGQGGIYGEWKLVQSLSIVLEIDEDGDYIVSDKVFSRYGVGATVLEAFKDFISDLTTYYTIIAESAAHNPAAASLLKEIQQYIRRADD